ncbi:MAG: hypothetical protein JW889_11870 [Verrucomicrobia bacterium]|nr:hypothetical protein [Verrucomicrobiota bacterium]
MRLSIACAALAALMMVVAAPAHAGEAEGAAAEAADKPTVEVVITFPGGTTMGGTLVEGTQDGTLKVRTAGGMQEFRRQQWSSVQPKQRPTEFGVAQGLLARKDQKSYQAAASTFQQIYDKYAHLYIFGAEALDGKARAEVAMTQVARAVSTYQKLFSEYSGDDLTAQRRYNYAEVLKKVGGKDNRAEAIAQLDRVVSVTDDVLTMKALNMLAALHYENKDYSLSLRASLQVLILYGGYAGRDITVARAQLKEAKSNALLCCDKLSKSSSAEMKRRVEKIQSRVSRMPF